jgi:hypothetical protein
MRHRLAEQLCDKRSPQTRTVPGWFALRCTGSGHPAIVLCRAPVVACIFARLAFTM